METWIWISLYIIQTLVGAVLWRKFFIENEDNDGFSCLLISAFVLPNILFIFTWGGSLISIFIDYLAGVNKNRRKNGRK